MDGSLKGRSSFKYSKVFFAGKSVETDKPLISVAVVHYNWYIP